MATNWTLVAGMDSDVNVSAVQSFADQASASATAASVSAAAAAASYDAFDDRYLGSKAVEPTLDNDGAALTEGALYFNSVSDELYVYNGSAWTQAAFTPSGYLLASNNLSDLTSAATARTNLGLAIGTDVQAYDAGLAYLDGLNFTDESTFKTAVNLEPGVDVQAYDAGLAYLDGLNFTNEATFKSGVNLEIGVDVQAYDVDTAKLDVIQTWTADQTFADIKAVQYQESYNTFTSTSNAATVDTSLGTVFTHTLTENTTLTFSNPPSTGTAYGMTIKIVQDAGASGFTITWPASVDWPGATAPTLTATASAVDVFVFYTHDGGTTWYGFISGQALG